MNIRPVTRKDYGFLYDLLESRDPRVSITHKEMPTWGEHCAFNDKKPYTEDYIIEEGGKKIGRAYIRDGMFLGVQTIDGSDKKVIEHMQRHGTQMEVAPTDKKRIKLLKKQGWKLLHYTYLWIEPQ